MIFTLQIKTYHRKKEFDDKEILTKSAKNKELGVKGTGGLLNIQVGLK
jgi:hypothetical protein